MYPQGPGDGRVIFGSNAAPLTSSRHEFSQSQREKLPEAKALWRRTIKNPDASTGPLACSFAHSLTPLTPLLAPHCLLHTACFACMLHFAALIRLLASLLPSLWESE